MTETVTTLAEAHPRRFATALEQVTTDPAATCTGFSEPFIDGRGHATVSDAMITQVKVLGLEATVGDVRALFADEHVHLALIVDDGRAVTTIDREDLAAELGTHTAARRLGILAARSVRPAEDLERVHRRMIDNALRRLVVLDQEDQLVGLLCLKGHGQGFCRDEDVQARLNHRQF